MSKSIPQRVDDVNAGVCRIRRKSNHLPIIPKTHPLLTPIISVIPFHLLAYHIRFTHTEKRPAK